jgi:hypothetical protein
MAPHHMATCVLPRPWQSSVDRTRARLLADGLLGVLDSFPAPSSFQFYKASSRGESAIRLRLGYRKQDDGSVAASWAYIELNHQSITPPVRYRDELPPVDKNKPVSYPRRASSLLRIAKDLLPPFRFLQFDSGENISNMRGMLCSLVLYYAMASGHTDAATSWNNFESSLFQALTYIQDNAEYWLWCDERTNGSMLARTPFIMTHSDNALSKTNGVAKVTKTGGTVSSNQALSPARPGTHLARLQGALKESVDLLGLIPSTPVIIERQDLFTDYFPFRLHIGKHGQSDAYVYLTHDVQKKVKIIAHGDQNQEGLTWTFRDLRGLNLFEPFATVMRQKGNLKYRGLKIRYLVNYYYMIADNEGLIDDPNIAVDPDNVLAPFCATCRIWKKVGSDSDHMDTGDEDKELSEDAEGEESTLHPWFNNSADQAAVLPERPASAKQSLIVRLRIRPKNLAKATKIKRIAPPNAFPAKRLTRSSNIIHISSDDDDTFTMVSLQSELESTSNIDKTPQSKRQAELSNDFGSLRPRSDRKKKKLGFEYSVTDDEEDAEKARDGDDKWGKAPFKANGKGRQFRN